MTSREDQGLVARIWSYFFPGQESQDSALFHDELRVHLERLGFEMYSEDRDALYVKLGEPFPMYILGEIIIGSSMVYPSYRRKDELVRSQTDAFCRVRGLTPHYAFETIDYHKLKITLTETS